MPDESGPPKLPGAIRAKLADLDAEITQLLSDARALLTTEIGRPISFMFTDSTSEDILSDYERAQMLSFVIRFENLPAHFDVQLSEVDGRHRIANLDYVRHVLNDFRPLVQNQSDSVYYKKIHKFWRDRLLCPDPTIDTTIRAHDKEGNDLTSLVVDFHGERQKAIGFVLKSLDFDYLYNGILQHSDERFSKQLVADYISGNLNYILWKHMLALGFIKEMLFPYYQLAVYLAFPKLGSL